MTHRYRSIAHTYAFDLAQRLIEQREAAPGFRRDYAANQTDEAFRKMAEVLGYRVERIEEREDAA